MPAKPEIERVLNCMPSQKPEDDWRMFNAMDAGIAAAPSQLPETVDLREKWWKIGDQGATGSCVGWAVADSVLRWHLVKLGRIKKTELVSVRYVWMASKEQDEFTSRATTFIELDGTSLKSALDIGRKYGVVLEELLPFAKAALYPGTSNTFYSIAANLRINAYYNLGTDQDGWRDWLANNGPIVTRLNVDLTWMKATDTDGKLDAYKPQTQRGGHAVALVGYTADRFIVRNSWGVGWGKDGFAFACLDYARDAFTESYGIHIV